jgi:hypothetical protein
LVLDSDGSGLRRITAPDFAEDPGSWSPDGKWILFSSKDGKVFTVHPDGSGLRQIRLDAGPGRYFAYQPAWSPDGTQIVLRLSLAGTGEQHLYTMRPPARTCGKWPTPKAAKNSRTGGRIRWPVRRARRAMHIRRHQRPTANAATPVPVRPPEGEADWRTGGRP